MTSTNDGLENKNGVIILLILCVLSSIVSLLIVALVIFDKKFHGTTEILMGNLAVADLILSAIGVPVKLAQALSNSDDFVGSV